VLVAIDVDSTLHDYWEQFSAAAMRLYGLDFPYADQHDWSLGGLGKDQIRAIIDATHDDERITEAVAYEGAAEAISSWRRAGHQILISTHRRTDAHDVTADWLTAQGIPFDLLRCGWKKVDHCREVGVGLLIDDAPENLELAIASGIAVATISHPWNQSIIRTHAQITHAPTWTQLADALAPTLLGEHTAAGRDEY
jgi:hypothetical protein